MSRPPSRDETRHTRANQPAIFFSSSEFGLEKLITCRQLYREVTRFAGQVEVVQEVAHLERGPLQRETLGLTLAEARSILPGLEQSLVEQQCATLAAQAPS